MVAPLGATGEATFPHCVQIKGEDLGPDPAQTRGRRDDFHNSMLQQDIQSDSEPSIKHEFILVNWPPTSTLSNTSPLLHSQPAFP